MKYLISMLLLAASPVFGQLQTRTFSPPATGGTTNPVVVDISRGSSLSVALNFNGLGWHTHDGLLGITNNPTSTNGQTFAVGLAGVTNTYLFTNALSVLPGSSTAGAATNLFNRLASVVPVTGSVSGSTLSLSTNGTDLKVASAGSWASIGQTNAITIGITNNPTTNGTESLKVEYTSGAARYTNTYTWGTADTGFSAITAQADATNATGQLFTRLTTDFPAFQITQPSSTTVKIAAYTNPAIAVEFGGSWATQATVTAATVLVTNSPSATGGQTFTVVAAGATNAFFWTNAPYVLPGATATASATAAWTRLSNDYSGYLLVTQPAAGQVDLVTVGNSPLTLTSAGNWATNRVTTNVITGNVILRGYVGNDGLNWFPSTAYDWSVAYSTTSVISVATNWTSLPAYRLLKWNVENAAGNYATASGLEITVGNR